MPFIKKEQRELCDKDFRFAEEKGDLCYLIYRDLLNEFKLEPRWKTIHEIYKTRLLDTVWLFKYRETRFSREDAITALHLAWQVFFITHVMPYEEKKIEENGDIA
jgi:hypothetical protein